MVMTGSAVNEEVLAELQRSVSGAVIAPADAGYDGLRRCFNALVDRRPAVIVRCFGARDVATAFDFARSVGLEVAVRGGGHNPAGHCVLDGGVVIDLSMMRTVDVKAHAKIALAEGGATWLDFDSATQAFGLVTPGGVVGSTGVAGLPLAGNRPPHRATRSDMRQPGWRRGRHTGRRGGARKPG
jgi:FAD/FMN-containing dehydrogenase